VDSVAERRDCRAGTRREGDVKLRVLTLAILMLAPSAAQADPRDDIIQAMAQCANAPDKAARSDCFERLIPQLRAVAGPAAAPAPVASGTATPEQQTAAGPPPPEDKGWLGNWNPFKGSSNNPSPQQMAYQPIGQEILPLTVAVTDFSLGMNGFTVTLANGQVWQGSYGANPIPPFHHDDTNIVTIDHGMLGGDKLNLRGDSNLYKVVRVK